MTVYICVKMKAEYIFDMLLHHMYSSLSGFLINMIGLTILMLSGLWLRSGKMIPVQAAVSLVIGVAVLLYTPLSLRRKANRLMRQPEYQSEIRYRVDDAGIAAQSDGRSVCYEWTQIDRAVSTPKDIVFYTKDARALVFPKESLQNDFMLLMKLIVRNMTREQVYIR